MKEIVLSNGKFFVNIDSNFAIRDFYFPYVGMYNHLNSEANSIGVYVNGKFKWIDDSWEKIFSYSENSLVAKLEATSQELKVKLTFRSTIHKRYDILIHQIEITNLDTEKREIKVYFYHSFKLNESEIGNTAYYDPKLKGLIHYKGSTYIYISSQSSGFEYTVSKKNHMSGSWLEIEKGYLSRNKIVQGEVDSGWGIVEKLKPSETKLAYYYLLVGHRYEDILKLKKVVDKESLAFLLEETSEFWQKWVKTKDRLLPVLSKILKIYTTKVF